MTDIRTRTLRILLAGAMSLGVLGTATAAHALTPPHQPDVEIAQPGPDDPTPPRGPDDLTAGEVDCNPVLASCDLAPNPTDPGDDGGSDGGGQDAEVDDAVVAHPTFTG
jgi:hypothetical protein